MAVSNYLLALPCTQAELARRFDVSRATVCNTIRRMNRDGLLAGMNFTELGKAQRDMISSRLDASVRLCLFLGMNQQDAEAQADLLKDVMSDKMRERIP